MRTASLSDRSLMSSSSLEAFLSSEMPLLLKSEEIHEDLMIRARGRRGRGGGRVARLDERCRGRGGREEVVVIQHGGTLEI